jgi:hopene-associated glycosyltransferase HpnB
MRFRLLYFYGWRNDKQWYFDGVLLILTLFTIVAWAWLLLLRGFFWKCELLPRTAEEESASWPPVAAIVPARNEAATIEHNLASLRRQDYPGKLSIILIDDNSSDDTAGRAQSTARGEGLPLHIIRGRDLPQGWTGKLWALAQGVEHASIITPDAGYLWLTDADIVHDPRALHDLVRQAENQSLDLISTMALLHCGSFAERLLIPAFVFFFRKLYPFRWVNDRRRKTAAAAGGSLLVRARALSAAGGLQAIRGALIDDCALAQLIKSLGPIRLELTVWSRSIRPYTFSGIWHMVARTAYTQLDYSPLWLLLTVLSMCLMYLAPLAGLAGGCLSGDPVSAGIGAAAWILMALAYWPTARLYKQPAWMALSLPAAATLFTLMTIDSARRHWLGRGGLWKDRIHHPRPM